ncbi:bifunctional [glutamate--ammonia ligase]-adenylyl-L-tyrosine phosphorylase/[glutamate--ammonia-ligase] adenylyltransferase [Telmatocola sphagniphila]|uniref:Bifunctional [glutamate--ammonia ligase]-adenylyl-L-tyrosine phosphorylase/[glutamate--ammonia-ligase] adenylyltransferase n=1 Tax=Telmatocola sphagniphila TaxID=1123043 RepID=A0A8E6ESK2_9BACT|nr:bifunctional [glutamate--ammonia ligase]-adenylyl-L-tyrosine phosphorylase/[glutamate--ammonia-ligase] adenylyltransferase [Telmatocola sphagniphila]QVL30874.1 bifunctional [glutamate--ammonia ligase]-adenylyl-L-tyrosine phosphorylase/[glutamate--ammonia-ligase] adenylyltransferase [Telmatocola sphagniphila]
MPRNAKLPLETWRLKNASLGSTNLAAIEEACPIPLREKLLSALDRLMPTLADQDRALNNLERLTATGKFFSSIENISSTLESLLPLFSTSQFLSDVVISQPENLDLLEFPARLTPTAVELTRLVTDQVLQAGDDATVLKILRKFRQRQMVRIGFNDIVRERPLEEITGDLSNLADACIEAALQVSLRNAANKYGAPLREDGQPSHCTVLAFGKLGAQELNYSSDIDLMVIFDEEGQPKNRRGISNQEFYSRIVPEIVRLLSAHTDHGQAYRVDLRLRPEGSNGALARSLSSTLYYYDTLGRTWERQALIKVRPVAGYLPLGKEFLQSITPFIYRKYLNFAEINGIKAMKRLIENKTQKAGVDDREVKTGRGGIRDIEFTIQFLQLLNGCDLQDVRKRGTLEAMSALEEVGCLTDTEYRGLDDAYRFLRKTEHRLQLLFDLQTHRLPSKEEDLRTLARRMGYTEPEKPRPIARIVAEENVLSPQKHSPLDEPPPGLSLDTRALLIDPLEQFLLDYQEKTLLNRTILDHLLHQSFADSDEAAEPETDLVLDPDPDEKTIHMIFSRYPFRNIPAAYANLMKLSRESSLFLSTRRCRHFLANIAPRLLKAISETPDPDLALENLEKVTASLGGKAVLWELFSFNPPSLKLYVDLCSNSPFLSEILINNPGMIDELLDSLVLNQPRKIEDLRQELAELTRGVDKPEALGSILHSFQDKEILRVGVRDLLGKDRIFETTAAISDIAETLLETVIQQQMPTRLGVPRLPDGRACRFTFLGAGKLGGKEMSYHSDLDLLLIYEGEGETGSPVPGDHYFRPVDNFLYFTELAQRVIKVMGQMGQHGKLYSVDMRLRPTGKSGSLVSSLEAFQRYYQSPAAQIWERQSMARARPLKGDTQFNEQVMAVIREAITGVTWSTVVIEEIRSMRKRLEHSASPRSLKRGPGGIADVEFAIQLLQIKYGRGFPHILQPNAWAALDALHNTGLLPSAEYQTLKLSYSFLRLAESRLRIVTNRPQNEYPEASVEQDKLARRLGIAGLRTAADLRDEIQRVTGNVRKCYESMLQREQA